MMKKLTTQSGVFGPYAIIETLPDRYRCDGADLPFTVVGSDAVISDVEPGDFPPPEPTPTPVPHDVSATAARDVLIDAGLLDDIDVAIAGIPDATTRAKAQAWWEYATRIRRDSPWVAMLAPALGLDDNALDNLFRSAAAVEQTA